MANGTNTVFDLDSIKDLSYITEEGEYTLRVRSFDVTHTADGRLIHKFICENVNDDSGNTVNADFYITDNAMWKYKIFLKALGHPGKGRIDVSETSPKCVGKTFIGVVKRQRPRLDPYTGGQKESKFFEVAEFKPLEG